ncbi:universal stress protein [Dyadobacter tibetensis]|uniref:universal stress protein n=1 Tax=Dyadobacter tibetensis TaxID=1211851 RepID=UPI00046E6B38|nr:universal stress protein [Dyadobacter tibetensis]
MKSILFPTDFTDLSLNAFSYAMAYAQKSNSKLIVYHSYEPNAEIQESTKAIYDQLDIQNFRKKKDKFPPFEKLIAESEAGELKVKYVVREGRFVDTLKAYVAKKEDKIDLVIMGTHGNKNSIFNIFMETNTVKILEDINKPLIAVPERATFDGSLDNFAFLIDYDEDEIKPLQQVIAKTQEFGSQLHVIHFDLAHSESIVPHMERFKSSLASANLDNVIFSNIDTIDIKRALTAYCKENNIDIVCLVNHKRNYYQRLFSYSLSEELLYFLDIPVMAIYVD